MLGGTSPFSLKALLGVLLPGAVLGVIAYGRPPERFPAPESVDITGFSLWIICVALLFEWEAAAVRDGSPTWHPSLTDLVNPLTAAPHEERRNRRLAPGRLGAGEVVKGVSMRAITIAGFVAIIAAMVMLEVIGTAGRAGFRPFASGWAT